MLEPHNCQHSEVTETTLAGMSVATVFEAASPEAEAAGDFFDAFLLPNGKAALAVADTTGKGAGAVTRTLQIRTALRAFAHESPLSPAPVVARLNQFACDLQHVDSSGQKRFTCLLLAILDPATGEGEMVSAGCEPRLLLRATGRSEVENFPLDHACLPLNITSQEVYTAVPFHLDRSDTIILMTDGITEIYSPRMQAQSDAQEERTFWGSEGVLAQAKYLSYTTELRTMGEAILQGARTFAGGTFRESACLLLARRVD